MQIVALPRVFNLSRREADMAIAVSPPTAGRLTVQKLTDYHLHLAARATICAHPPIQTLDDLQRHRMIGYIPDMIFDTELDYLADLGSNGWRWRQTRSRCRSTGAAGRGARRGA